MRRIIAALCMVMMLVSAASAEDFLLGVEPEKTEITPAYRSEHRPEHKNCYWCTPMDLTDEEAVWNMLTAPITVADLDMMKQTDIRSAMGMPIMLCRRALLIVTSPFPEIQVHYTRNYTARQ